MPEQGDEGLHAVGRRPLFSGAAVVRTEQLAFQRSDEIVVARADAERLGIAEGERVTVRHAGGATTGAVAPLAHARAGRRPLRLGRRSRRRAREHREGRVVMPDGVLVTVIKALVLANGLMAFFAFMTVFERKLIGRMQTRHGPNRVGPMGLLQPIADLGKLIRKQHMIPDGAHRRLYLLAPFISMFAALSAFALMPFGGEATIPWTDIQINLSIADSNVALLYVAAIGSMGFYGMLIGGWASGSKYALLGGLRAVAQLVSYEVAFTLAIIGVVIQSGTLSLQGIVNAQTDYPYIVPQILGFAIFYIAALAECNRPPFDLAEADGEIVAGFHTEYGGMRFAMFANAEFVEAIVLAALGATLFLGGWRGPLPFEPFTSIPGPLWMIGSTFMLLCTFIWVRATVPRLRYDRLMKLGWKVLLPLATLNLLGTAAWVALT